MDPMLTRLASFVREANSTNSQLDKIEVLKKYEDLKELFNMVLSGYYVFGVTSAVIRKSTVPNKETEDTLLDLLTALHQRKYTGHAAIGAVQGFIAQSKEHEEIILNCIDKTFKTRADTTLINRVFPGCVRVFEVALAREYKPKLVESGTWLCSRKLDGVRCVAILNSDHVKFYSRSGKEFDTLGKVGTDLLAVKTLLNLPDGTVFDGEICLVDDQGNESFQGIMKQINRKDHTIQNPRYVLFDMLDGLDFSGMKVSAPLSTRYNNLLQVKKVIENLPSIKTLTVLQQTKLNNDLEAYTEEAKQKGWEGVMLRKDVPYSSGRSNDLLKVKAFEDDEFIVKRVETGPFRVIVNSKEVEEITLSNIVVDYDGFEVSVGSGFSLEQRRELFNDPSQIVGKSVTVKFFERTVDQNGSKSLRFPVFKGIREEGT